MTTLAERQARFADVDVYVVTCAALSRGRADADVLEAVIAGGGKIIQLRAKDLSARDFFGLAEKFRARTRAAGVLLIINDHVDVAVAVAADGVHLGQDDLPTAAARRLAPALLLGRSTHSFAQALEAQAQGADYVNIGPIYATGTKAHAVPLGPAAIRAIGPRLRIPFTVMGGITRENIDEVVAAGARRIAVVTAVTQADDMAAAVRALRARITRMGTV